jgi:hypothetical protein
MPDDFFEPDEYFYVWRVLICVSKPQLSRSDVVDVFEFALSCGLCEILIWHLIKSSFSGVQARSNPFPTAPNSGKSTFLALNFEVRSNAWSCSLFEIAINLLMSEGVGFLLRY